MNFQISVSDSSLVVRMDASQAFDPGSSPGYRMESFFCYKSRVFIKISTVKYIVRMHMQILFY